MLRKAKRLPVIVMLVLIAVFLGSLSGCGDSADPLGTGIIQFYDATTGVVITSVTIQPGSSLTLVVRVKNVRSDATLVPVPDVKVTFTLMTPGNDGGLTVVNDRTAGNGQAMAVYTAGNNAATDNVRATTGNGATATIVITKTGGPVGPRISTLAASSTTVGAYQTSTITATVTDGNTPANPIAGEAVTFTIPMNQSDACFIDATFACVDTITVNTDGGGNAVALYRGGAYDPNIDVSDTVRAALANGSNNAVVITRSAATVTDYSITITEATPTVPLTGGSSVITANVKRGALGISGVTVTFTTSGGAVSPGSATTDGSGNAVTTFTAPAGVSADDTAGVVTASITVDGSTYADSVVVIYQ